MAPQTAFPPLALTSPGSAYAVDIFSSNTPPRFGCPLLTFPCSLQRPAITQSSSTQNSSPPASPASSFRCCDRSPEEYDLARAVFARPPVEYCASESGYTNIPPGTQAHSSLVRTRVPESFLSTRPPHPELPLLLAYRALTFGPTDHSNSRDATLVSPALTGRVAAVSLCVAMPRYVIC
jgi:hypothetical protein